MGKAARERRIIKPEANAEAERIIADYPRKELIVKYCTNSRDMSVSIVSSESAVIPFSEIRKGELGDSSTILNLGIKVVDITEDRLELEWMDRMYEVKLGAKVKTESYTGGFQYVPMTKWLQFEFKYVTLENKMFEIVKKVCDCHARLNQSWFPQTTRDEIIALKLIDELIREGDIGLYVLKAILMASNDWSTGEFVRPSLFRQILLEGIEKGCLTPDYANDWDWLETAAENNDPAEFMDDMDRWYDILASAVECGNEVARDIMNRIWEPEQIIEED